MPLILGLLAGIDCSTVGIHIGLDALLPHLISVSPMPLILGLLAGIDCSTVGIHIGLDALLPHLSQKLSRPEQILHLITPASQKPLKILLKSLVKGLKKAVMKIISYEKALKETNEKEPLLQQAQGAGTAAC